jgi:hypothetical protein
MGVLPNFGAILCNCNSASTTNLRIHAWIVRFDPRCLEDRNAYPQEEEDEKADEIPDADALERKRMEEAEEWRLQQLRAGTVGDNANFQVCDTPPCSWFPYPPCALRDHQP